MEGYQKLQLIELAAYADQTKVFNMNCNNNIANIIIIVIMRRYHNNGNTVNCRCNHNFVCLA